MKTELLGVGRIKPGAFVGCDHSIFRWPWNLEEEQKTFAAYWFSNERAVCRRYGYGLHSNTRKDAYGNGSVFVKLCDIDWLRAPEPVFLGEGI